MWDMCEMCKNDWKCMTTLVNIWPISARLQLELKLQPTLCMATFFPSMVRHFACNVPTGPTNLKMYLVLSARCISELEQVDALKWLPSWLCHHPSMRSLLLGMVWFYADVITQPFRHSRKDLKGKSLMTKHEFFSHAFNLPINNYKK